MSLPFTEKIFYSEKYLLAYLISLYYLISYLSIYLFPIEYPIDDKKIMTYPPIPHAPSLQFNYHTSPSNATKHTKSNPIRLKYKIIRDQ